MNEADVREWIPGEPLERVDFGGHKTGFDKRCPSDMSDGGLKKLMWRCAAARADSGLECYVDYVECSWTERPMFSVTAGSGTAFALTFDDAWTYVNGLQNGYELAKPAKGQDELANAVGVSRRTMNRILNGDVTVTYDRLTSIATALHTRLSVIIQRAEALASKEGEAK
ncbi:DNA-binding protein [Bifidobacterium animalis subsp. animalis]|uniref:helix-turn-helix domain-containing protein n=1 Tax=Bifidobacterium animalis TaxID=28025 RepID=UPI0010E2F512|nr:DNA-binding protein [Bifidobacterium animalis subsp. animalis]